MRLLQPSSTLLIALFAMGLSATPAVAQEKAADESALKVGIPGKFIRTASNDRGWVTLGYRLANTTVGEEWMLLEVVFAVPRGAPEVTITRSDIVLVTPDSKAVPLASQKEFQEASYLRALNNRLKSTRDSINYGPTSGGRSRPLNFFGDPAMPGTGALGKNEISVSQNLSATGRIYFHVPGGIQYGFHNLDVDFGDSRIKVPFDIFTKESEKEFEKKLKELNKKKD